jgi:hypothetical protein
MQDSLFSTPILSMQYHCLVEMRGHIKQLPLHYASYSIRWTWVSSNMLSSLGRGRGLLLFEVRGLRTSTNQLRIVDSLVGGEFRSC